MRSGCAVWGYPLVSWSQVIHSPTWRKVVRHVGTTAGLCKLQRSEWAQASGVGSSRPGEQGEVYITAHSPRPIMPIQAYPIRPRGALGRPRCFGSPKQPPTACVLGRSSDWLVQLGSGSRSHRPDLIQVEALASQNCHPSPAARHFSQPGNPLDFDLDATLQRAQLGHERIGSMTGTREFSAREHAKNDLPTLAEQSFVRGTLCLACLSVRPG